MPRGVVIWFDARTGEGKIRRVSREYPVKTADIEPDARVPFARVHFDIKRLEGVARATNVTLRRGRRVSPHQHRYGDLAGAHHPNEKGHHPLTADHPGLDSSFEGHPVQLVEEWVHLADHRDLSTLRLLYAPDAALHIGPELVSGRDAIVDRLVDELSEPGAQASDVHERAGVVGVHIRVGERTLAFEFRIAHGLVIEQWMSPATS
jgi:hypothetical protein